MRVGAHEPPAGNPQAIPTQVAPIAWFSDGGADPGIHRDRRWTLLDLNANPIGQVLGVPHAAGHGAQVLRFNDPDGNPDPGTTVIWEWGGKYFDGTDRMRFGSAGTPQANAIWDCSVNPPPDSNCNSLMATGS
jgi:hypothetical protein